MQFKAADGVTGAEPARTAHKSRDLTAAEIAEKLYAAILEHRIPPGTKLAEGRLATIFSVNRARIREVLARLAHDLVVELVPHQGAYVAKPTVEDARDVFEARRVIEPFTVRKLIETLTERKKARLQQHLAREEEARRKNDQPSIIRLSGEYHVLLAELAANAPLLRTTRELSTQTCLIISLYSASTTLSCRADEHEDITQAIIDKDEHAAVERILHHLNHIQESLELDPLETEVDLEKLFAGA